MINLLRGEIYKLFRSKCLYICSIVSVVFVLLIYGMFSLAAAMQVGEVENGLYGMVYVEDDTQEIATVWDDMSVTVIVQMMFSSVGILIVTIFASIFVFAEYANGAVKNVVGKGYSRWKVFTSKYISTVVGGVIIESVMLMAVLLCEVLIVSVDRLNANLLLEICVYVGLQLLLAVAFMGIIVMISQISRNLGAGIAIGVCMIMFSSFITAGLNAVLTYFKIKVNVCDYWLLDLISSCPVTDIDSSFLIRTITCAIVWFVVAYGMGGLHFRKVDVK